MKNIHTLEILLLTEKIVAPFAHKLKLRGKKN